MRMRLLPLTAFLLFAAGSAAQANVAITVDKDAQMMTVAVDGVPRYTWPVSTGNPSHETPNGNFRTFRMEADHFSKEFDDAPMPHSIFFTKQGHAIHGTDSVGQIGRPVSHGCVRLSRANAATLYALVEKEGVLKTTVSLTGSSRVALARNPRRTVAARNGVDAVAAAPRQLTPRSVPAPDVAMQGDDSDVIYPDGYRANSGYTADAWPGQRRVYEAQTNAAPPPRSRRVYAPRGYVDQYGYAQDNSPQYYEEQRQPRGYYYYGN